MASTKNRSQIRNIVVQWGIRILGSFCQNIGRRGSGELPYYPQNLASLDTGLKDISNEISIIKIGRHIKLKKG